MSKDNHNHEIEFVQWQGRPPHYHNFSTPTTVNDGHRHTVRGSTRRAQGPGHVHYYEGVTTLNDGHVHRFAGYTSPPIPLPGGGHYHVFSGQTTFDDGHIHYYSGRTGNRRY